MDDLLGEFLTEANESLDVVDVELVQLEKDPNNAEILGNIFRLVHTIKGTCGFLGLPRLEALAHAAETLMGKFRDGEPVTGDAVTIILQSIDRIKELLGSLEENERESDGDDNDIIHKLEEMCGLRKPEEAESGSPESGSQTADDDQGENYQSIERDLLPGEVPLDELEQAFLSTPGPKGEEEIVTHEAGDAIVNEPAEENKKVEANIEDKLAAAKPETQQKQANKTNNNSTKKADKKESVTSQTIRVNVETLEQLMTMVSELVLTRNQLLEMVRRLDDSEFKVPLQRLSNVTAELQEGVMKTRMQPIGNAWQKLPRIVRDLANELDKKIDLIMEGAETELDRQVLELIRDPLTHMVRNSADHGLEDRKDREPAGKSETGKITLRAFHEGGHIIIEIEDDGKGLNIEQIKNKIIENKLATQTELDEMSDSVIFKYIFKAGFSTAQKVTGVSGRGVGMDVVRSNIELIGGSVDVQSQVGVGSTFTIKIPLTLAIVSALIVSSKGHRFAVPQLNVVELVQAKNNSDHRIETINDTPVLRLRNKLLPLVKLSDILKIEECEDELDILSKYNNEAINFVDEKVSDHQDENNIADNTDEEIIAQSQTEETVDEVLDEQPEYPGKAKVEEGFIIVTQVGVNQFGIVVDSVYDTEEIVVKPMSNLLREVTMFSGNTILGDGSVILIVDPNGIVQFISSQLATAGNNESEELAASSDVDESKVSLLVFKAGNDEPKAVPLSLITRLEEVKVSEFETNNGRVMIQYRDHLMPIVSIDTLGNLKETGTQPILVFSDDARSMGLAVDQIVDVLEDKLKIELKADVEGVLGSAIIRDKATEIIDVGFYLTRAYEDWFDRQDDDQNFKSRNVLLVDDSAFFRNLLSPFLSSVGFNVTTVSSPFSAIELKEKGLMFDVIVTDIEMPEMNGFEFASSLKLDNKWSDIPIVALSSSYLPAYIEKARQCGFTDYVAKFDREGLVNTLTELFDNMEKAA